MQSFITRFSRRLISLAAIFSLSACATTLPDEHHLDAGARQHIKAVDAVLFAKQHQIGADVERNATLSQIGAIAMPLTMIPALLDAGVTGVRTANANKMVKPIREKLAGHNYPADLRQQLRQSFAGTTLDGIDNFKVMRSEYPGQRGYLIENSSADAVLFVDMRYGFTANFKTLYLKSNVMLFPNHADLKQFQETPDRDRVLEYTDNLYRNQFAVALSNELEDGSASENAAEWADLSQEKLVQILDAAALLMADTIANDIGIDDLDSDLNLIPEGYVLNTKFDNHNQNFAKIKALDPTATPPANTPNPDAAEEPGVNAKVVKGDPGS